MLCSLYIQNYALIEKLDIGFDSGFSVITGETGAGKSIILGAIGLLLGQRADVKSIRKGASKCIIEARFDVSAYGMQPFFEANELEYEDECILRRELYASGKSRAFINDTPASLVQMKELGELLIDVHSQHQNLLLNKEGFQLNMLDLLAHDDAELAAYQKLYNDWRQARQDLEALVGWPPIRGCTTTGGRPVRTWRRLWPVPSRAVRMRTTSASSWSSWRKPALPTASRKSWSRKRRC